MTDEIAPSARGRMIARHRGDERDFAAIRTGRASTALVERIQVEYYGTSTPLNQLASISVPEAHPIVIQPWDRSALGAIEKAIQKSDVGLMPNVDGTVVRLNIPPLTEERRKDLVKLVHKRMEEARVEIRNHRREVARRHQAPEKDGEIGTDDARREQERLEKVTDRWIAEVDRVGKHKGTGDHGGRMTSVEVTRPATPERPEPSPAAENARSTARMTLPRHVAIVMDGNRRWAQDARRVRGRGPLRRRRRDPTDRRARRGSRHRGALDLRLLARELDAQRRRGRHALLRCSRRRSGVRRRTSCGRASASRSWAACTSCPIRRGPRSPRRSRPRPAARRMTLNVCVQLLGPHRRSSTRSRRCDGGRPRARPRSTNRPSATACTRPTLPLDLLIRTGGEQRISNFLIWQAAYAELYFTDRCGPTSTPTSSTRRSPSTPAAHVASAASPLSPSPTAMRQRADQRGRARAGRRGIVFLLGRPWLTFGVAVLAVLAAIEAAPLVPTRRASGRPWHPRILAPLAVLAGDASPGAMSDWHRCSSLPALRGGRLGRVAAFRKPDLRDALPRVGMDGSFAALYVSLLAFVPLFMRLQTGSHPALFR